MLKPPKRCVLPVRPGNYSHSESAYSASMSAGRRVPRCSRHKACVTSDRLGRIRGMSSCLTCSRCRRVARERWSISTLVSCVPSKWNAEDREGCMMGSVRKDPSFEPSNGKPQFFVSNSCPARLQAVNELLTIDTFPPDSTKCKRNSEPTRRSSARTGLAGDAPRRRPRTPLRRLFGPWLLTRK